MYSAFERRFIRISRATIFVLFLVIIAGGVVRSTGSGMGCPDWPRCFNRVIPPTDVSQLPDGYQQHYVEGRVKKNERFAKLIERFGYKELADQIRHDESILAHEEFNAVKIWTEYINRLTGVTAGFFMLFTAFFSLRYWKSKKSIAIWSVLNLIVLVIQAWLGSIVVSTNLTPWIITVHMLLALVLVCITIQTFYWAVRLPEQRSGDFGQDKRWGLRVLSIISLVLLVIQVIFGTEVREVIDHLNGSGVDRANWIDSVGTHYVVHRFFSYLAFAVSLLLFWQIKRSPVVNTDQQISKFNTIAFALVVLQMSSGIVLARFGVPAFAQTFHLVCGSLLVGAQYYLLLLLNPRPASVLLAREGVN